MKGGFYFYLLATEIYLRSNREIPLAMFNLISINKFSSLNEWVRGQREKEETPIFL
jgi:hypothetical protein